MPWRTQTIMHERARFVLEPQNSFLSHAELCRHYGISRPTGYAGQPQREGTAFSHDTLDGDIPAQEPGEAA